MGSITLCGESSQRTNLWSIADYYDDRRPHLPQTKNSDTRRPVLQSRLFQFWLAPSVVTHICPQVAHDRRETPETAGSSRGIRVGILFSSQGMVRLG